MGSRNSFSAAVVLGIITAACGDDGDDKGGGKSRAVTCADICPRIEAAECEAAAPDCEAACEEDIGGTPEACKGEVDALSRCFANATFTCDVDGVPKADDCKAELDAWSACLREQPGQQPEDHGGNGDLACTPAADDTACDACMKSDCCDEASACDADCQAVFTCVDACLDDACVQDCFDASAGGAAASALLTCTANACGASCGG